MREVFNIVVGVPHCGHRGLAASLVEVVVGVVKQLVGNLGVRVGPGQGNGGEGPTQGTPPGVTPSTS